MKKKTAVFPGRHLSLAQIIITTMKGAFIIILALITGCSTKIKKVRITGEFPNVSKDSVILPQYNIRVPVKDGKIEVVFDPIPDGIVNMSLVYPWHNDTIVYRDKKDSLVKKVVKKQRGNSVILFSKNYM